MFVNKIRFTIATRNNQVKSKMKAAFALTNKVGQGFTLIELLTSKAGQARIKLQTGFTLIELLIVMAILGVLAVIVLVAINPSEQIARANDTGRISSVGQIGHQVQAYYTTKEGVYPDPSTWDTDLVESNQLGAFPSGINYNAVNGVVACTTNERPSSNPNFCYAYDALNDNYGALVFAKLESLGQRSKCTTSGEFPYFVYSTADGRAGVICASSDPLPWEGGSQVYLD